MADYKKQLEAQEISHNRVKLWLGIIGVCLTIIALAVERFSAYEQREYESEQRALSQRLSRMTEIGTEFDLLSARTVRLIVQAETDTIFLAGSIDNIINTLKENKEKSDDEKLFLSQIVDLYKKLHKKNELELKEWSEAIQLQADWESRENGFTPDFEHYFGNETLNISKAVAESAWSTINNQFVGEGTERLDDFKKISNVASKSICTKINAQVGQVKQKKDMEIDIILRTIALIVLSVGVFIAALTFNKSVRDRKDDAAVSSSRFYLDQCVEILKELWKLLDRDIVKEPDIQAIINIINDYPKIKVGVTHSSHLSIINLKEQHYRSQISKKLEKSDFKYFIGVNPSNFVLSEYDFFKAYDTLRKMIEIDEIANFESTEKRIIKISNEFYGDLVFYNDSNEQFFISVLSFVSQLKEENIKINLYDKKLRLKDYRRRYPIAMACLIFLVNVRKGDEEAGLEIPSHIKNA